jgi:hypothetical protein
MFIRSTSRLTEPHIDPEAEQEVSSPEPGASTSEFSPPWFTLEEVAATERSDTKDLLNRIPAEEAYEVRTTLAGIKVARAEGTIIHDRSRDTPAAQKKLEEFNIKRRAKNMPELTLEQLDPDVLIKELYRCKILWKIVIDEHGVHRWVNLHGPCNHAYGGRDGWVRHFKDEHLAKARYGRKNLQKKNSK